MTRCEREISPLLRSVAVIDGESPICAGSNREADRGDVFDYMAAKIGEQRPRSSLFELGSPLDVADGSRAVSGLRAASRGSAGLQQ